MFDGLVHDLMTVGGYFVYLLVESAPWLLLGFFMAALIKAFVPAEAMYKHLGGSGSWVTVKAALIGAPLPLCSCGVVPAALGLRASGASKNATVSFLVATPETGVDSVSFTYALMGPVMAIVRPIAAVASAIMAGLLVGSSERQELQNHTKDSHTDAKGCCASEESAISKENTACCGGGSVPKPLPLVAVSSCCSGQSDVVPAGIELEKPKANNIEPRACCGSDEPKPDETASTISSASKRLEEGLNYAFGQLLRDVVVWLLLGLLVAALVQHYVPNDFFQILGAGFGSMLLMAVIGIPMYVCATASTPIAAGFLMAGVSPGAVLVFMLLGPASNIGTLFIVKNELGLRALVAYLSGLVVSAFAFGFLLNYLADLYQWSFMTDVQSAAHQHHNWFQWLSGMIFTLLIGNALVKKWLSNKLWYKGAA